MRRALHYALNNALDYHSSTLQRMCLAPAAILAARAGEPERAAELLGLAYAAPRELIGWMERWSFLDEVQRQLSAELGAAAFKAAWEHGKASDIELVVRELLERLRPEEDKSIPTTAQAANQSLAEPLTVRELEVLRLIAEGLPNAQIAHRLFIAIATVKAHAGNIYSKLGVQNRTQAVAQARKLNLH